MEPREEASRNTWDFQLLLLCDPIKHSAQNFSSSLRRTVLLNQQRSEACAQRRSGKTDEVLNPRKDREW